MRKYGSNEKETLIFVEDPITPEDWKGEVIGCIVACGFCGEEFNEKDVESCPRCGKNLLYPAGVDW